ncbi:type I restriction enzyme, R subunit [Pseudoalteromonas carrageenovora]|uniref:Type I restriction enzyme endonuclease subunit n=1 Tax=Pseudoalteromonas carrageenovora IAM 12662 TaxID=1314868 RepID=A0A2K4X9C9_PSEVC|nr:HsdR family type I site-specific deoxyribonuclease [Pseudoalteromonas carrageenovora]MBE0383264.1 type I restriction enzyme, R subunit [Pseudoalteromonas carrageenovora IAM 12662]QBJ71824.1 type I restriction enzyme, R subunit [Pseudoalteromonas carrageenovora]GEB72200.1 restriction endonuclease subunit R [Pseudoalteromonas carrageenovora]SOU40922.1 Type-1 restriction enzyme R protein [Pseudoalteromonas carrageenovora IAM 12662]
MKFTEAKLEQAVVELLGEQGYPHLLGGELSRNNSDVLIKEDLRVFLTKRYGKNNITTGEVDSIIAKLEKLPASDLYESNKTFCKWLSDGFLHTRERGKVAGSAAQKDLYIQLLDYDNVEQGIKSSLIVGNAMAALDNMALDNVNEASVTYLQDDNIYRFVTQLEIESPTSYDNIELRIPDGILYVNGLPLVVFEFKSAIREQAPIFEAYEQLTVRYRRAIPQLFVFNTLCVISDGVNNKMGNLFAPYQFFYSWGKVTGQELTAQEGINSLHTLLQGLFDKARLRDVMRNFVFFPDSDNKNAGKKEIKIVPRYPQYYAANKLFENIKLHLKPQGDGKGGTYFGATGCGKSYTMQFLTRLLMKSVELKSPTIILITDRTDLDDQLSQQFGNAKTYIGDDTVKTVTSRTHLRELLEGRNSGGVFLTTIHKFTEDTQLLTDRTNVICISDEAHRSQVNLDQKITITEKGVKKTFGFAKYLHDSLPNATYVGFTGTPVDATLDVFGEVVDSYTMTESVKDEITVRIVYEGRAAKVCLNNSKLAEIETYYKECADAGSNELQIEDSKKATANMNSILGDPDRIRVLARDFVEHYEKRVEEGSTIAGKAMFVCSSRGIAYQLYQELEELRPQWFDVVDTDDAQKLSDTERKRAISEGRIAAPSEKVKMVMTRGKDDVERLYNLLGSKDERKELDKQFKNKNSNFKIAIVVDMWLTGFDVPFLDTMYIDKPLQKHSLIQTISRVNRQFEGKDKGLVVDYIGIKSEMNKALAQYSKTDETNFEDITASVIEVKNHLALLAELFHKFDSSPYFTGEAVAQLNCLNHAAEFALITEKRQKRFMDLVKRLKAAYDVCCGSEKINESERNHIHFYLAIRSIIYKLTKGEAPDTAQMNAKVREMISEALQSDGVEEVFKLGNEDGGEIDIFNDDYIAKIEKIKLPNTKIKILQQMLAKAIGELKKVNQTQGIDFTKRFESLVQRYNERKEDDVLVSSVLDDFSESMVDMIYSVRDEMNAGDELGIDIEEKGFYDALKALAVKYDFDYPEDKLIELAQAVKVIVDDKVKFVDWNHRDDIKSSLKVELILILAKFKYPPISRDEVYKEIFEQAQSFKINQGI